MLVQSFIRGRNHPHMSIFISKLSSKESFVSGQNGVHVMFHTLQIFHLC